MTGSTRKYVLAVDTASSQMAVALGAYEAADFSDLSLVAQADQLQHRQANVRLLPAVDQLLRNAGVGKSQLAAVVAGLGPGSFTGVRIALASAKGIARALKLPLYGVSSLDAIAWKAQAAGLRGSIGVVADAMRHEVYPVRYELSEAGVFRLDAMSVAKVGQVLERWQSQQLPLTLLGDGLEKYAAEFTEASALFRLADPELWPVSGQGLLTAFAQSQTATSQVAHRPASTSQPTSQAVTSQGRTRQTGEAGAVLPIYTRLSDAEENERLRLAEGRAIAPGALVPVPASGVAEPVQPGRPHIRPLAMQDVPAVAELERLCFPASPLSGESWSESAFRAELYAADRSWWVAWQGNQLIGFAGGWLIDGCLQVLNLAVAAEHRRQGVARELLGRLIDDARAWGAGTMSLEVRESNQAAIALYSSMGFTSQGRRVGYYAANSQQPREDALVMAMGLNDNAPFDAGSPTAAPGQQRADNAPLILAIETSCDETAAAIIDGQGQLLADVVASQVDYHARFGGVVPEIASRKHTEAIVGVVDQAMEQAGLTGFSELSAVAVTYAPGLIGALVVGLAYAKGLAWGADLPLVRVNHLEGHIYANRLTRQPDAAGRAAGSKTGNRLALSDQPSPPFVAALLSGGHTMLVEVRGWADYRIMGQTLDDAVGEAFDKVAKALGLGYPGGPVISRLAAEGDPRAIDFPRALLNSHGFSFSLSGLKTAVITWIRQQQEAGTDISLPDVAASFQQAVIDVQVAKALAACQETGVERFCLGGGVAANQALREAYEEALAKAGIQVFFPLIEVCSDNAAMIAAVAIDRYRRGQLMPLDGDAQASSDLSQNY